MARPREFDTTQALDQAMQVFWSKGYEATSLSDLTDAMKLSKSSFYDTFGSKHEVFLAAIEHYKNTVACQVAAVASAEAPARKLIAGLFERAAARITEKDGRRGCFLNNCCVEVALHDPQAAKLIGGGFGIIEDTFFALIERGRNEGDIAKDKDARALARYLTCCLNGLMVVGKAKPEPKALADIARISLSALD